MTVRSLYTKNLQASISQSIVIALLVRYRCPPKR
jgi:hypothetical protein